MSQKAKEKKGDSLVEQPQQQADPAAALMSMTAFEDQRFLVQTIAIGDPDPKGMREISFPVSPTKQITLVLVPELLEHIVGRLTENQGDIQVADLSDVEKLRAEAKE